VPLPHNKASCKSFSQSHNVNFYCQNADCSNTSCASRSWQNLSSNAIDRCSTCQCSIVSTESSVSWRPVQARVL